MNTRKLTLAAWLTLTLLAASVGVTCASKPKAASGAFDMKAALDRYFSNLPDGFSIITPAELNDQIHAAKPFIVDIREAKEIADAGYIADSINIPTRSLLKNLDKLPPQDRPIVVACGGGHRSALAMEALQLLSYTNVKSLAGGLSAWKAAGLPVTTGMPLEAKASKAPEVETHLLVALDTYFSNLPNGWSTIAPIALKDLIAISKPFQLEVRETKEVADSGFIPGSTVIPIRTLIRNLDKLPPDKGAVIVTECGRGHESAMVMLALNLLGYTNVRSLAGGFAAWTKAGLPVSK